MSKSSSYFCLKPALQLSLSGASRTNFPYPILLTHHLECRSTPIQLFTGAFSSEVLHSFSTNPPPTHYLQDRLPAPSSPLPRIYLPFTFSSKCHTSSVAIPSACELFPVNMPELPSRPLPSPRWKLSLCMSPIRKPSRCLPDPSVQHGLARGFPALPTSCLTRLGTELSYLGDPFYLKHEQNVAEQPTLPNLAP